MASLLGSLKVRLSVETGEFRQGLAKSRKQLTTFRKDLRRFSRDTLANVASLSALALGFRGAINAANEFDNAQRRLAATARLTGTDLGFLQGISKQVQRDFKLSSIAANELTTEIVKLTGKAGDMSQSSAALAAFLDIGAARGLNAEQTLQAVRQAILGIDEGTDKLFGANPSVLYKRYADAIGTTVGKLTDQQKAQAIVNAALRDGTKVQGEYLKWLESAQGQQAQLAQSIQKTQAAFGKALRPVMLELLPILQRVADWVAQLNGKTLLVAAGVATLVGALGPAAMVITQITTAVKLLGSGLTLLVANPIGLTITAIAALVTAGIYLWKNWDLVKLRFAHAWEYMKLAAVKAIDLILAGAEKLVGWIPGVRTGIANIREEFDQWAEGVRSGANQALEELRAKIAEAKKPVEDFKLEVSSLATETSRAADQAERLARAVQGIKPRIELAQSIQKSKRPTPTKSLFPKKEPKPDDSPFDLGMLTTAANAFLTGDSRQIGSTLGNLAGSFIPIPGAAMLTSTLGGMLGGLFDKEQEEQKKQTAALQRIDRNTRQSAEVLELTRRMEAAARGFANVPAGFTVPRYAPGSVSVVVQQENHFAVPDERVAQTVRSVIESDLGDVLYEAFRKMGLAV